MKQSFYILVLALTISSLIFAQSAGLVGLSGQVVNQANSASAGAGQTVTIQTAGGETLQTVTDAQGNYSFNGLDSGNYDVFVNGEHIQVAQLEETKVANLAVGEEILVAQVETGAATGAAAGTTAGTAGGVGLGTVGLIGLGGLAAAGGIIAGVEIADEDSSD
ncbi:carboxypeptidase-like regulatory domain-containing protein [Candidatus Uabimicrobium amorphum]|uniref:SD-repeat containing protein B domain-containing protein n=1 Tax=Uabimicrobium amorphum TaxID=2596890 RepID=A0A5S9F229_UABAM|nr:carboxypeptidase-like regulatory domain-containing protein [Candidatus Uabimicrobium amorphum]BBM81672.1 hypothetical protein UABAM_00011 [Candidatus Uabimicrobium amorphum]